MQFIFLADASPALWRALQARYTTEECLELSRVYEEICQAGALREWPVTRAPGVSFNPRPARIVQILLKESDPSFAIIKEALLSCAKEEENSSTDVQLAHFLDQVRHLHMNELSEQERTESYNAIEEKLSLISTCTPRLKTLVTEALKRYARYAKDI